MKTKFSFILILAALLIGGGYLVGSRKPPVTVEKIVNQEVVKYVDRVVDQKSDTKKTTTFPNGTIVVEETKSDTIITEREKSESKTKSVTTVKPVLSKYSLGVSVQIYPDGLFPPKREYQIEAGYRLGSSPFWGTLTYSTDKRLYLGMKVEF